MPQSSPNKQDQSPHPTSIEIQSSRATREIHEHFLSTPYVERQCHLPAQLSTETRYHLTHLSGMLSRKVQTIISIPRFQKKKPDVNARFSTASYKQRDACRCSPPRQLHRLILLYNSRNTICPSGTVHVQIYLHGQGQIFKC